MNSCTRFACFLQDKGAITLPLVTIAGIVDGINPCSIGMLVFLLGYLLIFVERRDKILKTALVYITTVYLTYLVLGFFLYEISSAIGFGAYKAPFQKVMGLIFLVFSILTLKDLFFAGRGPNLRIPLNIQGKLKNLAKNVSYPTTALFAFLVTVFEAPCSLPVYAGTAQILANSGLSNIVVFFYFLYYNLLFVLPLILISGLFVKGVDYLKIEDLTHRAQPKMKLAIGITLLFFSVYFLFF